jgi:hypothetical protein
MDWSFRQNWDEFAWSKEIRKDELRIAGYFRALPSCLDLPGEEEMISSTIAAQGDLLPAHSQGNNVIVPWSYLAPEGADDDSEENGSPQAPETRRPGEHIIEAVDKLATQWNLHCAATPEINYAALSISCAYAKLLARCADFFDVEEGDTSLKRCLGKRCLGDLRELHAFLGMLAESAPGETSFTSFQQKRLIGLREQLSKALSRCR